MTDIETGVSSPGGINGLLMWQQVLEFYLLYHNRLTRSASSDVLGKTGLPSRTDSQDFKTLGCSSDSHCGLHGILCMAKQDFGAL